MRTVIIGNGAIGSYGYIKEKISESDYIICADGGYNHAKAMGIAVNLLVGDFDSIDDLPNNIEQIRYPVRKDVTDSHIALQRAREMGSEEIILLGFTGDRLDHTINNIMLLLEYREAVIIDDNNEIRILKDTVKLKGKKGQTVSIIPISSDLLNVTTKGLEYPLNSETLYLSDSRGISNVMTDNECEISIQGGLGLLIKVEKV